MGTNPDKMNSWLRIAASVVFFATLASGFAIQFNNSKGYGLRITALEEKQQAHAISEARSETKFDQMQLDIADMKKKVDGIYEIVLKGTL